MATESQDTVNVKLSEDEKDGYKLSINLQINRKNMELTN